MKDPGIIISRTQVLNLGHDLRQRLEAVAREQGTDGTYLGRRIVREYVEQRERKPDGASVNSQTVKTQD